MKVFTIKLVSALFMILSTLQVFANHQGIDKGLYKLSQDSFSHRYSFDDTSDALIFHTYHQRHTGIGVVYASRLNLLYKVQDYKEVRKLRTEKDRQIVKETIAKREFKLSRREFLRKYGTDDSMKSLINVFFNDRFLGWCVIPIYPALITVPGLIQNRAELRYYSVTGQISEDGLRGVLAGDYYTVGILGAAISGAGVYVVMNNSRKKLYKAIMFYQKNGFLPPKYHERIANRIERMKTDELIHDYNKKKKEEQMKEMIREMKQAK